VDRVGLVQLVNWVKSVRPVFAAETRDIWSSPSSPFPPPKVRLLECLKFNGLISVGLKEIKTMFFCGLEKNRPIMGSSEKKT
jgi:hypothetical protein